MSSRTGTTAGRAGSYEPIAICRRSASLYVRLNERRLSGPARLIPLYRLRVTVRVFEPFGSMRGSSSSSPISSASSWIESSTSRMWWPGASPASPWPPASPSDPSGVPSSPSPCPTPPMSRRPKRKCGSSICGSGIETSSLPRRPISSPRVRCRLRSCLILPRTMSSNRRRSRSIRLTIPPQRLRRRPRRRRQWLSLLAPLPPAPGLGEGAPPRRPPPGEGRGSSLTPRTPSPDSLPPFPRPRPGGGAGGPLLAVLLHVAAREDARHEVQHVRRADVAVAVLVDQPALDHVDLLLRLPVQDAGHEARELDRVLLVLEQLQLERLLEPRVRS